MAYTLRYIAEHLLPRPAPRISKDCKRNNEIDSPDTLGDFPRPIWTFARRRRPTDNITIPQIIAHRGYKAAFPENSMPAFEAAIEAGADALETDLHVTRDGVVVLSHDANLKRCFGLDANVRSLDWEQVAPLSSTQHAGTTSTGMARLDELLAWLAEAERQHVWLLLDIKPDVEPALMLRLLAGVLHKAPGAPGRHWRKRIVLGVWSARYLPLIGEYLPGYSVTHVTFSTWYSGLAFLGQPHVCFNALEATLGGDFVARAHASGRSVTVWTVNDVRAMRRACGMAVDGVITDEPGLLRRVCEEWSEGGGAQSRRQVGRSWREEWHLLFILVISIPVLFLLVLHDLQDGVLRSWRRSSTGTKALTAR